MTTKEKIAKVKATAKAYKLKAEAFVLKLKDLKEGKLDAQKALTLSVEDGSTNGATLAQVKQRLRVRVSTFVTFEASDEGVFFRDGRVGGSQESSARSHPIVLLFFYSFIFVCRTRMLPVLSMRHVLSFSFFLL
jgi:hypothetical protein